MSDQILQMLASYSATKRSLAEALGTTDALLHVHLGLALFALTALVTQRRIRSFWPLGIVAAFAIGNEIVDYFAPEDWSAQLSAIDVANTLLWPLMLFLLARRGSNVGVKV